jgi:hypothetical protein
MRQLERQMNRSACGGYYARAFQYVMQTIFFSTPVYAAAMAERKT